MDEKRPAIFWLRQDLRLEDNPALHAASKNPLLALYIWDEDDPCPPGGASMVALQKLEFTPTVF